MGAGFLGILSLDTAFPRIVGDAGNVESYPFPTRVRTVPRAEAPRVVSSEALSDEELEPYLDAARALEAEGASALTSTCGFLIHAQSRIAEAVGIPVMLSALSLYPTVQATVGGRVLIVTASAEALDEHSLNCIGIEPESVSVAGLEGQSFFAETFLVPKDQQRQTFDQEEMQAIVLNRIHSALADASDSKAILLECGNLPPYAAAIRAQTGLPVYSILDGAALIMAASSLR